MGSGRKVANTVMKGLLAPEAPAGTRCLMVAGACPVPPAVVSHAMVSQSGSRRNSSKNRCCLTLAILRYPIASHV